MCERDKTGYKRKKERERERERRVFMDLHVNYCLLIVLRT